MIMPRSKEAKKKRSGLNRRKYDYNTHIPERRSLPDRRIDERPSENKQQEGDGVERRPRQPE